MDSETFSASASNSDNDSKSRIVVKSTNLLVEPIGTIRLEAME